MRSGKAYQLGVAGVLVLSVSAVGAAVSYSKSQGALRVQTAVLQAEAPIENVPAAPGAGTETAVQDLSAEDQQLLQKQLRTYRVRQSADGKISGRINMYDPATGAAVPATGVRVMFLQRGGIVQEVRPGLGGVFQASVAPGVYGVVMAGAPTYAAYSIQVIPPRSEQAPAPLQSVSYQEITDTVQLDTLGVPASDFPTLRRLARTALEGVALEGNSPASTPEIDAELTGEPPVDSSMAYHQVSIQADGRLLGRVRRLHPETGAPVKIRRLTVFLVRDNAVVDQTQVTEGGFFAFKNVQPSVYSFVSSGGDGFGAFSFQAVSDSVAGADTPNELTLVSFSSAGGAAASAVVGPENVPGAVGAIPPSDGDDGDDDEAPPAADAGGASAGPGGGGTTGGAIGGAPGGGLGIGELLGLAGLGAGIAALADDDNKANSPPGP